jgi:hypothetical protein
LAYLVPLEQAIADLAAGLVLDPVARDLVLARLRASIPADDWDDYQMHHALWALVDGGISIRQASRATAKKFKCCSRTVERRIYSK